MIYITRQRNVRTQGITGIFGSIELTDKDGKTLSLLPERDRGYMQSNGHSENQWIHVSSQVNMPLSEDLL